MSYSNFNNFCKCSGSPGMFYAYVSNLIKSRSVLIDNCGEKNLPKTFLRQPTASSAFFTLSLGSVPN